MGNRTLSVVIPNYNHAHYIEEALESILSQSFRPLEVIVVDDGSTDNSVTVIERFARQAPIVRLLQNEQNMGAVFSVSRALEHASGDCVCFQSADDKVLPGFFEKSMSLLARYPQAGLCCSYPTALDDRTVIVHENRLYWSDGPRYFSPDELAEVIQGGYIAGHTSIVKRSALLEVGGLIPELRWHCDWFAVLVVGFRHGICYIPEPLATIRVRSDSYSASGRRDWSQQKEMLNYLLRLLKSPDYRDVLPYFVRGSIMSHFGDEIVRVVMSDPEHWDMETLMLIQEPLWSWNTRLKQNQSARWQKSQQAALENRGRAAFERGDAAIAQGRYNEALAIFAELVREFPDLASGHTALADVAVALRKYQVALNALTTAIKLSPNDPELHNQLGATYYRAGQRDRAAQAFQQALALDPTNLNVHINLAEIARAQGHHDEAARYYRQALEHHPNDVDLWVASGRLAIEVNDPETARAALQRALALDPSRQDARRALETLGQPASVLSNIG